MKPEEIEHIASKAYIELVEVKLAAYTALRLCQVVLANQGMTQEQILASVQQAAIEAKEMVDHEAENEDQTPLQ